MKIGKKIMYIAKLKTTHDLSLNSFSGIFQKFKTKINFNFPKILAIELFY
jgi:hypothetical protein